MLGGVSVGRCVGWWVGGWREEEQVEKKSGAEEVEVARPWSKESGIKKLEEKGGLEKEKGRCGEWGMRGANSFKPNQIQIK